MLVKPLLDLGFNSQKCRPTFVNWYYLNYRVNVIKTEINKGGAKRRLYLFRFYILDQTGFMQLPPEPVTIAPSKVLIAIHLMLGLFSTDKFIQIG